MTEEEKNDIWEKIFGWFFLVLIAAYMLYTGLTDENDQIAWVESTPTLIEAKYILGGSWIKKDQLTFESSKFIITKNNWITGKKIIDLPYKKVNFVSIKKGYWRDLIRIKSEGGWFSTTENFYIKNRKTTEEVAFFLENMTNKAFILIQEKSLLESLKEKTEAPNGVSP